MCSTTTLKTTALICSVVTFGLAVYSHFWSQWTSVSVIFGNLTITYAPYEICNKESIPNCPDIVMEQYFVGISAFAFAFLLFEKTSVKHGSIIRGIDGVIHLLLGNLLLVGAIFYLVSAYRIQNVLQMKNVTPHDSPVAFSNLNTLHQSKLIAGGLAVAQAVLYGAISHRCNSQTK